MDFLGKLKLIRNRIKEWQKKNGDEFNYVIQIICKGDEFDNVDGILIGVKEHEDIIKYLAAKGFIKIIEEQPPNGFRIKVLPEIKPHIKLKTLELMARELKDYYTGGGIIALLKNSGVNDIFITYPQSKWLIFYDVFEELAISKDKNDMDLLFKIITEAIHPLNLGGNQLKSDEVVGRFNDYLRYDDLYISYREDEKVYKIFCVPTGEEREEILTEAAEEDAELEKSEIEFFQKPENKEKISTLRKAYQVFINIVEVFCENPSKPTHELNDVYINTKKLITDAVCDLHLYVSFVNGVRRMHTLTHYCIPFNNLFTAEAEYKGRRKSLNWSEIRPEMHATYGDIDELYQKVSGSDILADSDKQKKLNDIQLYLSKLKEKTKDIKKNEEAKEIPATKIEITKLPPLELKNSTDSFHQQTKDIAQIPIRDVRLDESNFLLEINNGEKIISFKSKKKGEGLEKETKQFKILYHLWDFCWEIKNSKVIKKGDYTSLENLVRGSGSESADAAYKHIQRLNIRFKNEGVAIEIKGENEKYRLIINKA